MRKKINIVLDANVFINPSSFSYFGKTKEEALNNFLEKVERKKEINCFIPPSVYKELGNFINLEKVSLKRLLLINKKPPSQYEMPVPAIFIYEFIEDIRGRINKGLRIAEKFTRQSKEGKKIEELIKTFASKTIFIFFLI